MPGTGRTIYIAGAGIAGLSLALGLAKFGASVVVMEREPAIQEYGAGLQIGPNAFVVLDRLGLAEAVAARSFEPEGIDLYPLGRNAPLLTLELGELVRARFGAPYLVMHRADLIDVLQRACRRFANIEILLGVRSFSARPHPDGVAVSAEEADGRPRSARAFGFVGADGIHSLTRTALLGGATATFGHAVAWRALLTEDALDGLISRRRTSLFFGPGCHAVCYPLPYRGRLNVALFLPDGGARENETGEPVLTRSARQSTRFTALIEAGRGTWGRWPLGTVTTPAWHRGPIGLIGDAAHAMVPFGAQGAAMGIEDAAILAPLLMSEATAEAAFARFESARRPRVERVARMSGANGRAFHMRWPFAAARDTVLRAQGTRGHLRRLRWLYGYDPFAPGAGQ